MTRLALPVLLLVCASAAAQTQPPPPPAAKAAPGEPDVAILATVRAAEVRFDDAPAIHVTVAGAVNGQPAAVESRTERVNLPDPVQPNVTYRDIGIRLTITSTLPDIERILDEALGTAPAPAATTEQPAPRKPTTTPRKKTKS